MAVAELEKTVSKKRSMYSPEDLFEVAQGLGYQSAHQDKPWQVLTRGNEFVAARVYRATGFKKMAYPISGQFESLDEVVNNLGEIKKYFSSFFNFSRTALCGGGAAGLTGTAVAGILEEYANIFSERPWIIIPALACQLVLVFSGLIVGGLVGHVIDDRRFSQLPESAQEYLFGYKAVDDLLSKVV